MDSRADCPTLRRAHPPRERRRCRPSRRRSGGSSVRNWPEMATHILIFRVVVDEEPPGEDEPPSFVVDHRVDLLVLGPLHHVALLEGFLGQEGHSVRIFRPT
jgi:hypothetical protein